MKPYLTLLALFLCALPCHAQSFALRPINGQAQPLRLKSLEGKTTIHGQFASAQLTLTFQNESEDRMEADFFMKLPPQSVATYFAYWAGEEKVVGRVVEKERAAEIYKAITSRQRDPALVELTGKGILRARIFPVEPDADLKVEVHFTQVLPRVDNRILYEFQLKPKEAGTGTLEKLDLTVDAFDGDRNSTTNNFGITPETDYFHKLHFHLQRLNFRADKDWRIAFTKRPQRLAISGYTGRLNGQDGYFAIALTPSQTLRRPRLKIAGVSTYSLLPSRLPTLRAGKTFVVCGKYRGEGMGTVSLLSGGAKFQSIIQFTGDRYLENPGATLWANRKIVVTGGASLSARRRAVALSKQFNILSPYTTWLAVPEAEREEFEAQKAETDLYFYGRQIAFLIRHNQGNSADAKDLKARFMAAARSANREPKGELKYQLGEVVDSLDTQLRAERARGRKASRSKMRQLNRDIKRLLRAGALNDTIVRRQIFDIEGRLLNMEKELSRHQSLEEALKNPRNKTKAARYASLKTRYDELVNSPAAANNSWGGSGFRTGDPLLQVNAAQDAQSVTAIFPDGTIRPLTYDATSHTWQLRFDIPTYADEGDYSVSIIIVEKDGTRRTETFTYGVDLTPPSATASAIISAASQPTLRLELQTEAAVRAEALLPWGERQILQPSQVEKNAFFALTAIPQEYQAETFPVTYTVTDAAHNRTSLTVEASR